ncbi:hypothetical protein E3N88_41309 [Mikania micrantha]|uniref:AB hydrolase-1 domain-containing protein n=1 Tax=Mikania micrantha TaxID=192012 RepID=A0A5N6LQ20_9ASTR|nr:hypothetical protein E3N88_41309 [Mikania micrantha]
MPGTLMNIWVPKEIITKNDHNTMYIPPTKPAVLLLHAFTMDGIFTWFLQVFALTREYAVYVPDLLFFGGSITNRNERSVNFQAEFVARGLGILKVEKTMYRNRKERNELLEDLVIPDKDATSYTNFSHDIHMVWGGNDKIFDLDHAMTMKTQLGDKATLDWIKDAGHLVPLEQPFKYNKRLKCILERVSKHH